MGGVAAPAAAEGMIGSTYAAPTVSKPRFAVETRSSGTASVPAPMHILPRAASHEEGFSTSITAPQPCSYHPSLYAGYQIQMLPTPTVSATDSLLKSAMFGAEPNCTMPAAMEQQQDEIQPTQESPSSSRQENGSYIRAAGKVYWLNHDDPLDLQRLPDEAGMNSTHESSTAAKFGSPELDNRPADAEEPLLPCTPEP